MPKIELTREELFPSLSKEIEEKTKNKEDSISDRHKYIDIIKNKEKTEPTEKKQVKDGWVEIKKKGREIIYESGKCREKSTKIIEMEREELERKKIAWRIIMDREKYRNELNELMGDMSPYINWVLNPYEEEDEKENFKYESEVEEEIDNNRYSSDEY